jgi:hypothetical protein
VHCALPDSDFGRVQRRGPHCLQNQLTAAGTHPRFPLSLPPWLAPQLYASAVGEALSGAGGLFSRSQSVGITLDGCESWGGWGRLGALRLGAAGRFNCTLHAACYWLVADHQHALVIVNSAQSSTWPLLAHFASCTRHHADCAACLPAHPVLAAVGRAISTATSSGGYATDSGDTTAETSKPAASLAGCGLLPACCALPCPGGLLAAERAGVLRACSGP